MLIRHTETDTKKGHHSQKASQKHVVIINTSIYFRNEFVISVEKIKKNRSGDLNDISMWQL